MFQTSPPSSALLAAARRVRVRLRPQLGLLTAAILVIGSSACDPSIPEDLSLDSSMLLGALNGGLDDDGAPPNIPDNGEPYNPNADPVPTPQDPNDNDDLPPAAPCDELEQAIIESLDPQLLAEAEACYENAAPQEDPCQDIQEALANAQDEEEAEVFIEELEACYANFDPATEDDPCAPLVDQLLADVDPQLLEQLETCDVGPQPQDPCEELLRAFDETGDEIFLEEYGTCTDDFYGQPQDPCEELLHAFDETGDEIFLEEYDHCIDDFYGQPQGPCEELLHAFDETGDAVFLEEYDHCIDDFYGQPQDPCEELLYAFDETGDEIFLEEYDRCIDDFYGQAIDEDCEDFLTAFNDTGDEHFLQEYEACLNDWYLEPNSCEDLLTAFDETGDETFLEEYDLCIGGPWVDPCEDLAIAFEQSVDPALLDAVYACFENSEPVIENDPCEPLVNELEAVMQADPENEALINDLFEALDSCYANVDQTWEDPCQDEIEAAVASADQQLLGELEACYEGSWDEPGQPDDGLDPGQSGDDGDLPEPPDAP